MENAPSHPPSSILHPRRIIVRGVNWLGDAVMTTPALLRLREKFPAAHIALLTPEKLADLWKHHAALDEVIPFRPEDTIWHIASKLRNSPSQVQEFVEGLQAGRREFETVREAIVRQTAAQLELVELAMRSLQARIRNEFDLALVLPNSPRSALEVFFARIPQRVGYARPWRNFFLTQAVPPRAGAVKMQKRSESEINHLLARLPTSNFQLPATAHQIYEYLHLAATLGASPEPLAPQLAVTPEEIATAKKTFGLEKIASPIFGLNPGAEYGPAKRWPVEKFIAAAKEIQQRSDCVWLIFGGKGDVELAANMASGITNHESRITNLNLAGKTSLRELMALLKICRVLLTNDTGPMHVAAALGTPVVVPFGSTSPELTGPGLPGDARHRLLKSDAPCSPCFLRKCPIDFRCMNGISVERVVAAVVESLKG
jgi:heptosyltransferase-2